MCWSGILEVQLPHPITSGPDKALRSSPIAKIAEYQFATALDLVTHEGACPLAVVIAEGLQQLFLAIAGCLDNFSGQETRLLALRGEDFTNSTVFVDDFGEKWIARCLDQQFVELLFVVEPSVELPLGRMSIGLFADLLDDVPRIGEDCFKFFQLRVGDVPRRLAGGAAFKRIAEDVKIVQFLPIRLTHERSGTGDVLNHPFACQTMDRFANRNDAYADLFGQRAVHQPRPVRQNAGYEFAPDVLVRSFREALIHFRFPQGFLSS